MAFTEQVAKQRSKNRIGKFDQAEMFQTMKALGSVNYVLNAIRQAVEDYTISENINDRISRAGGCNTLEALESIFAEYQAELQTKTDEYYRA